MQCIFSWIHNYDPDKITLTHWIIDSNFVQIFGFILFYEVLLGKSIYDNSI